MIATTRVVAVTPAGRRRYMKVLLPYLLRDRHIVDAWHIWLNTTDPDDLEWLEKIAVLHPDFIHLEYPTVPVDPEFPAHSVYQFFERCVDPGTIYVRLDDDIVYIHQEAIARMVKYRLLHPEPFLVYANTVNNSVCTHLHQRLGVLSRDLGTTSYFCLDPVGWRDGTFAAGVHLQFLQMLREGDAERFMVFPQWEIWDNDRFSINCIAWSGSDFATFQGVVDVQEESWLTVTKPRELGRSCVIVGDALVSHYAYFTQRPFLDQTNILDAYKALCV